MSLLRRIEKGGGSGGAGGGDNPPPRDSGGTPPANPPEGGPGDESRLAAMRARNQQVMGRPAARSDTGYGDLKTRVQNRLLSELDQSMDLTRKNEVRAHIEEL